MPVDYLKKLNETFFELLSDLITAFPNDGDFHVYLMAAETAVAFDNTLIYRIFQNKVICYESQILAKDEQFLINIDMESKLEISTETVKEYLVYVIRKLRGLWHDISNDDRDIIWRYFRTMVLLYHKVDK